MWEQQCGGAPPPPAPSPPDDPGPPIGIIIGAAAGALVLVGLLIGVYCCLKKRGARNPTFTSTTATPAGIDVGNAAAGEERGSAVSENSGKV
jgi:hypothetical protein